MRAIVILGLLVSACGSPESDSDPSPDPSGDSVSVAPGEPPTVEILPLYEEGTVDHACDVFIQTLFRWSDARSNGAEIGQEIADLTDRLIADLESRGVTAGAEDLATYAEKYRTLPIIQAHEEAEAHLAAANQELADRSVVCGHLSTWGDFENQHPGDVDYHRFRWQELGYDDYTARVVISDRDDVRGEQQLMVVVRAGVLAEVHDIRTAQSIERPGGVPLTVAEMFEVAAGTEDAGFHPVLGYPYGIDHVFIHDVSPGIEFDRSILGSTADVSARVETVDEFIPDLSCGAARVPGDAPIPSARPLDDDAIRALDALNAEGVEGTRFTSNYSYGVFERTEEMLVLLGDDGEGNLSFAQFEGDDDRWNVVSWGTCRWESAGYRTMPWFLDPEVEFEPDSREIHLLVGDECGSHTRFGNEFIVVTETSPKRVTLDVWRAHNPPPSPDGPEFFEGDCPTGQVAKLTVNLDEPVGDRTVAGATDPADWPDDF